MVNYFGVFFIIKFNPMQNGWIKLHRKFIKWEWYDDINTKVLFLHILLSANHKDKNWRGQMIKRGQFLTGRIKLAKETGLSEQSIRTSLNRLKSTSEVTIKSTSKNSIITVVKWEEYQETNQQVTSKSTSKLTNKQPASNQQVTTTNNVKKEKNVKNISKEIVTTEKLNYGNNLVNRILETVKKFTGLNTLDDTIGKNRQYAYLLYKHKILPEFKNRQGIEPNDEEIINSLQAILNNADNFHRNNITNIKYIYYNFGKLIQQNTDIVLDLDNL